jgi:hypothetical protein
MKIPGESGGRGACLDAAEGADAQNSQAKVPDSDESPKSHGGADTVRGRKTSTEEAILHYPH